MNRFFQCCSISLLMLLSSAHAQQKPAVQKPQPPKPTTPGFTCPDAEAAKTCASFKQLLDSHDKDILDLLTLKPVYVCFRPKEDAFLVFHIEPPSSYGWRKGTTGNETQFQIGILKEYREGVLYLWNNGYGNWVRFPPDKDETFEPAPAEPASNSPNAIRMSVLGGEVLVEYPFTNQSNGTTEYSLTIRQSTGRFVETFDVKDSPNLTTKHLGSCAIYR
jgi:hypothetical protein